MKTNMQEYMKNRRLNRRQKLLDLSGNICKKCNSKDNLEFDHRIKADKLFTLSGAALDKSWETILIEHSKCDLLCEECHKTKTKLAGDLSQEPWNKNKTPYKHGSPRTYTMIACRCNLCKQAKKLYRDKIINYLDVIEDKPSKVQGLAC